MAQLYFFRCLRLAKDDAITSLVITPEEGGQFAPANVAINAVGIDVKASRSILGESFKRVSHKRVGGLGEACFFAP